MANNKQTIKIESILGGISDYSNVYGQGEYLGGMGIDPELVALDSDVNPFHFFNKKGGMLTPVGSVSVSSDLNTQILHMTDVPQNTATVYVYSYGANGSLFSTANVTTTNIPDGGSLSNSSGNGFAYYDNYLYMAKDTTIARYGPLDGTPTFNGDYWVTTLGKTALSNSTNYPYTGLAQVPNHQMFRHSDGRLYFYDILDNQAVIHYIKTRKTTVEGDTDDGSTYAALTLGYNLMPTAISATGEQLVIATLENNTNKASSARVSRPKLYFWDGIASRPNSVIWAEVPGTFVTAMNSLNGSLILFTTYRTAGGIPGPGFAISQYLGGQSFQTLFRTKALPAPVQSATYTIDDSLVFGSTITYQDVAIYRGGLFRIGLDGVLHGITALPSSLNAITAIHPYGVSLPSSFYAAAGSGFIYLSDRDCSVAGASAFFLSQIYDIGNKFKITKIELNLSRYLGSDHVITASIWKDSFTETTDVISFATINSTNYPNTKKIVIRPNGLTCENNFFLKLEWTGEAASGIQPSVVLPVIIEYELIED